METTGSKLDWISKENSSSCPGFLMSKRSVALVLIIVLALGLFTACSPGIKMASRQEGGTATRTPFLSKATYTATNTPLQASRGEESGDTDQTLQPDFAAAEQAATAEADIDPSLSPSPSASPEMSPTGLEVSLTTAAPSATLPPPPPTNTSFPLQPTATSAAGGATSTPPPPASTAAPRTPSTTPLPTATRLPTETPAPTATSAPTATTAPAACSPTGNSNYENQVVNLINQERQDRGLSALTQNSSLRLAARRHSEDMACNDFFSHTGSDGSTLSSRILAAGYSYSWAAENIAASSSSSFSAQSVVNMWMNSPGHRSNILSENAVHIGVGFIYAGDSDPGDFDAYYTSDFGRP